MLRAESVLQVQSAGVLEAFDTLEKAISSARQEHAQAAFSPVNIAASGACVDRVTFSDDCAAFELSNGLSLVISVAPAGDTVECVIPPEPPRFTEHPRNLTLKYGSEVHAVQWERAAILERRIGCKIHRVVPTGKGLWVHIVGRVTLLVSVMTVHDGNSAKSLLHWDEAM